LSIAVVAVLLLGAFAAHAAAPSTGAAELHLSPDLSELSALGEHGRTYRIMLTIFQLAAIVTAAKLCGWLTERIKVPGVIGELLAGVIIGPFLLGSMIPIPLHGQYVPLFPRPTSPEQWPVSEMVWSLAQCASIILLFVTGLHTNLRQFLRYVGPATVVAICGLLVPFALGAGVVYIPYFSRTAMHDAGQTLLVPALFVGSILAATSIGITARVLGDIGKLDTSEGVTIIGAAVLDDVLGIIALAIVGGIAATGSVSGGAVSMIAGKAVGFWVLLTALVLALAKPIERVLNHINYAGAIVGLGLSLAFIGSGMAEGFGLAFIIGAYSVGLGLSQTRMAHRLMSELQPISDLVVPIFFAALGMLVDFQVMLSDRRVIIFGLVITSVAIVGKVIGCGTAAMATGFNARGAYRIGLGMMPRGEVALIVAGIGLSQKIIGEKVFGVSIMMTLLTTVLAPIMLVPAFRRGGDGRRAGREEPDRLPAAPMMPAMHVDVPPDMGRLLLNRMVDGARQMGWLGSFDSAAHETYVLRKGDEAAELRLSDQGLHVGASGTAQPEFNELFHRVRDAVMRDAKSCAAVPDREPAEKSA
jgi:Kef-type K+ transport system membrane component KefB